MNHELICIGCPMGCRLVAVLEEGQVIEVTGNSCPKGVDYARNECTHPVRMLTTTVMIRRAMYPLLSVRTTRPISKTMIKGCMVYLGKIEVTAPIEAGQVIVKNILNTGADIIATKNLERV
ncbi:MAG TPA: molybdopterin oxidoreductase [Firmicutes bacterium]|jgi:CxxC motif-containing protein|nr:molybdopterin oxidoreductase [Bacillota bacterium]